MNALVPWRRRSVPLIMDKPTALHRFRPGLPGKYLLPLTFYRPRYFLRPISSCAFPPPVSTIPGRPSPFRVFRYLRFLLLFTPPSSHRRFFPTPSFLSKTWLNFSLPTSGNFFNINPASGRPGVVSNKHLQCKNPSFGRSVGNMLNNGDCIRWQFISSFRLRVFPGRFFFFTINKIKGVSNYV